MISSSCCKDCPNREVGCHSKCEAYLKYRAKQDLINAMKLKREQKFPAHLKFQKESDFGKNIRKPKPM